MKKLFLVILCILPFFSLHALPSFNIAEPSLLKDGIFISDESFINVRLGFSQGYLKNEDFVFSNGPANNLIISATTALAKIIINLKERLDIGALIGTETPSMSFKYQNNSFFLKFNENWFYCARFAATVFEIAKYSFGGNFLYYYFKSHTNYYLKNTLPFFTEYASFKKKGWVVNIGVTREFGAFSPYLGIAICNNSANFYGFSFLPQSVLKANDNKLMGCFFGCGIENNFCLLNIETRFINETAAYFSIDLRF